ncbi:hypothetical protein HNV12_03540 [Methanococcoides sp. SA1]|nr:hypothetical protein [Methanococcoides sp. SA1]
MAAKKTVLKGGLKKMKKLFRKATTVAASAAMIGMTVGLAAAASYPEPFTSNTAIVVGANAAPSDNIAAASIAANLDANAVSTGDTTIVGGDSYKFEKTSVKFHLGDNISYIRSSLDDDELPTLLAEGKFIDDDNDEFDYTQKIEFPTSSDLSMWEDNDYAEDEPTVGFRLPSGENVLNYTLTFNDEPLIADLTTTNLPIMGKEYYVLSNSTSGANLILTLLDSASDALLTEGETATLNVGGTAYTVTIDFISSTEVKLTVNGETTNSLAEAATYKLTDGSYVGIKDILYSAKDTGISKVEFSIGSGKLKLTSGSEVQINDNAVSGLTSVLTNATAALNTATATLASVKLVWAADDDMFITEGSEITMPEFEVVKLSYGGMSYPTEEIIEVKQGGDSYAVLENFPLKDGEADIAFLYGSAGGPFTGIGKDATNKLITSNTSTVTYDKDTDEYFIASYAATTEGESYLMRATNFVLDGSTNKTDIQYYKDGVWTNKKTSASNGDTFSIGNAELGVGHIDRTGKSVVITANSSSTNFYHLYSKEGMRTYLPFESVNDSAVPGVINFTAGQGTAGHNGTTFYLNFAEEDKDGNIGAGDSFNVSVGWDASTTAEVEVSDLIGEDVTAIEIEKTDVWRSFMYSALATEFLWTKPTSGQNSIKIVYHGDEVIADVYATSADATVTSGDAGVMTVNDDAVSTVSGKNLVVVGGSAINSVAAELLGGAYSEAAFTDMTGVAAGEFMIESFSRSGKTALLVAGYAAADTEKAVTYLLNNDVDTTVGMKYEGMSATEASLVVA